MNQESGKSAIVILLLVGAAFVAVSRVAESAPLADWWLVLALLLLAALLGGSGWASGRMRNLREQPDTSPAAPTTRVYESAALPTPPPAPRVVPSPIISTDAQEEEDYGRIRDTEVRADMMASAVNVDTLDAGENDDDSVENVMDTGAGGTPDQVDEIAGAPAKSISKPDRTATQEMRAALSDGLRLETPPPMKAVTPEPVTALVEAPPHAIEPVAPAPIVPVEEAPVTPPVEPIASGAAAPTGISDTVLETAVINNDLTIIEGIGPKMSAALIAGGIDTFAKLADSSEEQIRAAIQAAGMRFAPSVPTWPTQAKHAANGDWDGLKSYQSTLKSGRAK